MILRDYQTTAVEAAWQALCNQIGNPVISAPTGCGKSLMIAELCRRAIEYGGRVIVLAHRKELLEQNADKIRRLLPDIDIGIYSAGLKSRDTDHAVIVAGIQSIYKKAHELGSRQLVILDECHLLPVDGDGIYQTFLGDLRKLNQRCRLIGLTATPYRLGDGKLCTPTGLLNHVCHKVGIKTLTEQGHLCRLVSAESKVRVDTSGLHHRQGEFLASEADALFAGVTAPACAEIVELTRDRNSCLIFCSGVANAQAVAKLLGELTGERAECVTGETPPLERAAALRDFRDGRLKYLTNCDVLTTGFDAPCVDFIGVLRATESAGLFAQILGRGMRVDPSKQDCRVADFGQNLARFGPLDAETYGERIKGTGKGGEQPMKVCPACGEEVAISAIECDCGWIFPRENKPKHDDKATGGAILMADIKPQHWIVEQAHLSRHKGKEGKPDTLRADYTCQPLHGGPITYVCPTCGVDGEHITTTVSAGRYNAVLLHCEACGELVTQLPKNGNLSERIVSEWVCIEHTGFAQTKAKQWWSLRSISPFPESIDDAIELWQRGAVALSSSISTVPDGKYTKIIEQVVDARPEEWSEVAEVEDLDEVPF